MGALMVCLGMAFVVENAYNLPAREAGSTQEPDVIRASGGGIFVDCILNLIDLIFYLLYSNQILNRMVDVNEPISRGFSICLRFFQLGLQLMIAQFVSKIANEDCSQTLVTIGLPISYILLGINLIAILLLRCRQVFNQKAFYVLCAVNVILAGVIMIVGFGGIGQTNSCANNKVVHRYTGFQSLITIVVSVMTLFGQFDWSLRYTNAPGNFVWPFLFLAYNWTAAFKGSYITVGVITLLISIATFIVNLLPLRGGLTSGKKNIIHYEWLGALILMAICQIIVFATYLTGSNANDFNDVVAKKLAQTYLPINIVDALFWTWGILTLKYTSGDVVRDNIMQPDNNHDQNDLDHQNIGIGTIKR